MYIVGVYVKGKLDTDRNRPLPPQLKNYESPYVNNN